MSQLKIPFFDSDIGEKEIKEVTRVLESRWLTMGEVTKKFEEKFCELTNSKYAFAVANGTAALHLATAASGVGPGDEVIVPSFTFAATVNSILYTGATPIFADITSEDNFNISPEDIERKITPKTKAITLVHYGGHPCDMPKIMEIAERHNLSVIEDAAHAPGAGIDGKSCGTYGLCGCFSFFSNKNLATGEGGMIVTDSDEVADSIRLMRSHGMTTLTLERHKGHAFTYDVVKLGYNYRISEIISAIGIVQLDKLIDKNKKREQFVKLYQSLLSDIDKIAVPFKQHTGTSSYHIFPVLLKEGINRTEFIKYLREHGIQVSIHYPPVHQFTYHKQVCRQVSNLEITENVALREVTLPLYPTMNESNVITVINQIKKFLTQN